MTEAWLAAVGRRLGGGSGSGGTGPGVSVSVLARTPLAGGYGSGVVERVDLDVDGREIAVVRKRSSPAEVAAMRAVAVVEGDLAPRMLAAAGDDLVVSFVAGEPLGEGPDVPVEAWTALARVHAHWFRKRPRAVPVVDAGWWRALCDGTLVALRGGLARTGEPAYAAAADLVDRWGSDPRMTAALAALPRTLCHGDAHRGNVLLDGRTARLIDWGNARVAPAGLDVATLAAQGDADPAPYYAAFAELSGLDLPADLRAVEWAWAQVHINVGYLGFAADHLGTARVTEMVDAAAGALARL
ncbi:MAG: aminoglycoside phosphotransferase family protein [Pseudonocardia sp.]|nr:aminoglycoside phosphotransferase family protein [Pseudonocardia sp.]